MERSRDAADVPAAAAGGDALAADPALFGRSARPPATLGDTHPWTPGRPTCEMCHGAVPLHRCPAPLDVVFPADSSRLAQVRNALRGWLAQCDLPPCQVQDVLLASGEACANAIEHGHRGSPGGPVRLRAEARLDALRLTVADSGRWKVPRPEADGHRGRGMALMRALMQQVTITSGPTGTTVDMYTIIAR